MKSCKECINFNLNYGVSTSSVYEKPHGICNLNLSKEKFKNIDDCCENFEQRKNCKSVNDIIIKSNQEQIINLLNANNIIIERYLTTKKENIIE